MVLAPAACKQELAGPFAVCRKVLINSVASLLSDLELHRTACLALADRGSIERLAMRRHIIDHQPHEITSAQLAVDRQIEEGQVPNSIVEL